MRGQAQDPQGCPRALGAPVPWRPRGFPDIWRARALGAPVTWRPRTFPDFWRARALGPPVPWRPRALGPYAEKRGNAGRRAAALEKRSREDFHHVLSPLFDYVDGIEGVCGTSDLFSEEFFEGVQRLERFGRLQASQRTRLREVVTKYVEAVCAKDKGQAGGTRRRPVGRANPKHTRESLPGLLPRRHQEEVRVQPRGGVRLHG